MLADLVASVVMLFLRKSIECCTAGRSKVRDLPGSIASKANARNPLSHIVMSLRHELSRHRRHAQMKVCLAKSYLPVQTARFQLSEGL